MEAMTRWTPFAGDVRTWLEGAADRILAGEEIGSHPDVREVRVEPELGEIDGYLVDTAPNGSQIAPVRWQRIVFTAVLDRGGEIAIARSPTEVRKPWSK